MLNKTTLRALLAAGIGTFTATSAMAAVTAEEAKQLGTTLTQFGALAAGNADGSIPPYTGGLPKVGAYDPKTMNAYIDPFAGEKALYSIDAKNMAQYDALLTPGTKAILKQYSTYRVDVYPSHRTARYPQWVLNNTIKNATTATLGGEVEGDLLQGADDGGLPYRGVPFPIPKTGYEVLWNQTAKYSAAVSHSIGKGFLVDTSGGVTELGTPNSHFVHPWYDTKDFLRPKTPPGTIFGWSSTLMSPPSSAGIVFLNYYTATGQKVWFYTPGQRRVRLAPEFSYDVPIASYGGVTVWDDIYGYVGRLDRYDYKLVGRREMIVPYNVFGTTNTLSSKDIVGPQHVNPAAVRWEKHRVWVVEGTRKANARHAYSRRTFYIDEDSWAIVASENYDNGGALWRVNLYHTFPTYDTGGVNFDSWTSHDLIKGNYFILNVARKDPGHSVHSYETAEGLPINLTPAEVSAASVR